MAYHSESDMKFLKFFILNHTTKAWKFKQKSAFVRRKTCGLMKFKLF